jgi:hypothetical protein
MFNFEKTVHLVLEQPKPTPVATPAGAPPLPSPALQQNSQDWLKDILAKHKELGLGEVTESDINRIFPIVTKGYIAGQDARAVGKNILILDVLKNLWESASPKPAKNLRDFLNNKSVEKNGAQERDVIVKYTNRKQWEVTNGLVANALGKEPGKSRLDYATQALGALAAFGGAKLYG